jgi:hypothetical protein
VKNSGKQCERKTCAFFIPFKLYIACINLTNYLKMTAKKLYENYEFRKIEFIIFEITFIRLRIWEKFLNEKVAKFTRLSNGISYARFR